MVTLPILLIEDEESSRGRLKLLSKKAVEELSKSEKQHLAVTFEDAKDYRQGLEKASRGTYPLAIVDLKLQDPEIGVGQRLGYDLEG